MLGGDSDVDGKLTHPAFWFGFHPQRTPAKSCSRRFCYARASSAVRDRRTAGDRNSNAATTGKTELDDPPFIIGLRPLLLALVARCIPSSGCKHGLHNLIRLIEFSRYDDSAQRCGLCELAYLRELFDCERWSQLRSGAAACFFVGCARDREYKNDPSASVIHDH
jgi:hypothetical protein